MPCNHKFQSYLNLERLDFQPTTLIVGTFNPEWPVGNYAEWFYGRIDGDINDHNTGNHFWAVLPRLYGEPSLKFLGGENLWKQFCHDKKIAITDIIGSIADANQEHEHLLGSYSDDTIANNFYDFDLINIVRIIRNHPSISNIYITRSITETFWSNKLYSLKRYCVITGKTLKTLLTPSDFSFREQGRYNRLNPGAHLNREDFILKRWREEWHF